MRHKMVICSIIAAALLILGSFVSAIGYQSTHIEESDNTSPLFAIQTQRANQKPSRDCISSYLGKGNHMDIFPAKTQQTELIQKAIQLFSANPGILNRLLERLESFPALNALLTKYDINAFMIKRYIHMLKDNPSLLTEEITNLYQLQPQDNGPEPLGLSTSNPLGCVIVAIFALVPLTIVLTLLLLLFTLRILTCLNVNDCGDAIVDQIWSQLYQGLSPG